MIMVLYYFSEPDSRGFSWQFSIWYSCKRAIRALFKILWNIVIRKNKGPIKTPNMILTVRSVLWMHWKIALCSGDISTINKKRRKSTHTAMLIHLEKKSKLMLLNLQPQKNRIEDNPKAKKGVEENSARNFTEGSHLYPGEMISSSAYWK